MLRAKEQTVFILGRYCSGQPSHDKHFATPFAAPGIFLNELFLLKL